MSLGLSDLNKKRRGPKPTATTPRAADRSTARPWSEETAPRATTRGRPRPDVSDIALNDEWMDLQIEPIFWIDLSHHSFLLKWNERMAKIEARIQRTIVTPALALRDFFRCQK